jgi:fructose-1,6-bisphosphatase/inositol monophosphatase family enzyme
MSTSKPTPAESEITARLELARAAALEAGQLTLRYFQSDNLAVERKADDSPVTVADKGAEELLRQRIAERFAADGILGEEFGETPGTSGYRWILDPIDGTKSFISGVPLYGTMVAVERDGQALLGVVYIPGLDECIHAAIGQGAWHQRGQGPLKRARVSPRDKLSDAVVCSSDGGALDPAKHQAFDRLRRAFQPHVGRLLRIPAGGHRPSGDHGRPGAQRLGRRRRAAYRDRSRRHVYRLARKAQHLCRRGDRHQRPRAGSGAGYHSPLSDDSARCVAHFFSSAALTAASSSFRPWSWCTS